MRIADYILEELEKHPRGIAGGTLERNLFYMPHKLSGVAREARRLRENGIISYNKDNGYVEYILPKFLR